VAAKPVKVAAKVVGKVGPITVTLFGILLAFAGLDAVASLTKYKHGETVSKFIQTLQDEHPVVRLAVTSFLLYLIGHLELGWPL
jgi:hypothetical protein